MNSDYRLEFAVFGPSQGIIYSSDLGDVKRRYMKLLRWGRMPAIYKADSRDHDGKIKWRFMRQGEE